MFYLKVSHTYCTKKFKNYFHFLSVLQIVLQQNISMFKKSTAFIEMFTSVLFHFSDVV